MLGSESTPAPLLAAGHPAETLAVLKTSASSRKGISVFPGTQKTLYDYQSKIRAFSKLYRGARATRPFSQSDWVHVSKPRATPKNWPKARGWSEGRGRDRAQVCLAPGPCSSVPSVSGLRLC